MQWFWEKSVQIHLRPASCASELSHHTHPYARKHLTFHTLHIKVGLAGGKEAGDTKVLVVANEVMEMK